MTKALIRHIGKYREHFYGENFIHEYPKSWRHIKPNQNMDTHHTLNNCVRETINHGPKPSEIYCGDAIDVPIKHGPNYKSNGCTLMEVVHRDKSSSTTPHMGACSKKLTGEANSTEPHVDFIQLTGKVMKHTQLDTTPQKLIGWS